MSNDLISRKALMEELFKTPKWDNRDEDVFFDLIDNQPTAYDTDKVVEQIHDYFKGQLDIRYETLKFADEIPIDAVDDLLSYNKVVCTIVEEGGVSNETD